MKSAGIPWIRPNIIYACIIISFLGSCAGSEKFVTSSIVPAAEGNFSVRKDKNKNYVINIRIVNLADSKRLDPPRDYYVVWMIDNEDQTRNLGQIKSSSGLFSKKLVSTFKTVTPYKPKKIFITAERNADMTEAGSTVVLTTNKL